MTGTKINFEKFKPVMPNGLKLYIETYGCQMNVNDTEVVISIMKEKGYSYIEDIEQADIILINTCSIRDNAEQRIWGRLREFGQYKKTKKSLIVGIIGCMAERLKERLIEKEGLVDLVIGPDAYRTLPDLVQCAERGEKGVNVVLSRKETYDDITPVRLDTNGVTAFVSIMRGCNNMCSYCVVPYTRGVERSRDPQTILNEVADIFAKGYKEVTLLGQNVNSYIWTSENDVTVDFPTLMESVALISPELRIRFATSHPKDLSDKLLDVMAKYENICNNIHLPAQSGSTRMLEKMNRKYTRQWYMERIEKIREYMPNCGITTDIIAGFCSETEEDHKDTLSLMEWVGYEFAYMFNYSERPDTKAARTMQDDVPAEVKNRRLTEIINLQNELSLRSNKNDVNKVFKVLTEGVSKRSSDQLYGRTEQNKVAVFPKGNIGIGEYVYVKIIDCTSATLIATVVE